jgi:EAL domain-containing protein (putative c-di-GMP-specific phosphodiesterase class I)
MLTWDGIGKWGRRASDAGATPPAAPTRDLMLEAVIAYEQVELLYQPQIEPRTGWVVGVEALARSPIASSARELFARATAGGLQERLSRLLQRKALRAAVLWEGPLKGLKLSINLLPQEISRAGYEQWLLEEVHAAGIDPKRITAEITESALVSDNQAVAARLDRLRDAGIRIAIDDFGTGYASLAYLTTLPLDIIKIDRGLIADLVGDERSQIVVKALIRLARELGLEVIVEGVESAEQLDLLKDWGCDLYQGFLGSQPLTIDELTLFVGEPQAA